ncbi:transposase [Streptomyces xantholiticus]|uniref:transposase n=1 Tax=Streptomyces xantholiticus TaxID=68285 RepID=UPI003571420C
MVDSTTPWLRAGWTWPRCGGPWRRRRDRHRSADARALERLIAAGQWHNGDLDVLVVVDAGYDVPRLSFLLRDLPVQVWAGFARTVSFAARSRHGTSRSSGDRASARPPTSGKCRVATTHEVSRRLITS